MKNEIRVTEINGKIPKIWENCRNFGKARM
jgi:hypothetical protein